jgi:hypothetical protein
VSEPQETQPQNELQRLRQRITDLVAQRDALKQAIETGALRPSSEGLRQLESLDQTLSALDTAFKQRWDAQQ